MRTNIHPSAHVDSRAEIDVGVEIGPLCVIGPNVRIAKGTKLHSQVNIDGHTEIGPDCRLSPFVTLGHPPQDFKHKGGSVSIKIGARTVLRETVNIHPGSDAGRPDTIIGNDCYFMYGTHVAHEGQIGNNVILSNGTQVGGCVTIGDNVIIGGLCAVHQFTRIGNNAFIGGMTTVTKDVIPYGMSVGNKQVLKGLNRIGMERSGISRDTIRDAHRAYKFIFEPEQDNKDSFRDRVAVMQRQCSDNEQVMQIIDFINSDRKRKICTAVRAGR